MSFIKKHPILIIFSSLFILFVVISSVIPYPFMTITTSLETVRIPDDIAYRITSSETGVTYELDDLKTDATISYPKQLPLIPMNYGSGGSIIVPEASLYLIYEGNLSRGSRLALEFEVTQTTSGRYHYFLLNEDGIVDSFETTLPNLYHLNLKLKKSGNYTILLSVDEAVGHYQLNFNITKSLFPF